MGNEKLKTKIKKRIQKRISVPIYWTELDDKKILIDEESITEEFERKLKKIMKGGK